MSSREFTTRFRSPVAAVMGQFVQQKQAKNIANLQQLVAASVPRVASLWWDS